MVQAPGLGLALPGVVLVQQRRARQEQEQDGVQARVLQPVVLRVPRVRRVEEPERVQVLRQQAQEQ